MQVDWITLLGVWVAAGLTLFMYSFLYKDNPFFKFGEHLYIGVSVGYSIVTLIFKAMKPKWYEPLTTDFAENWMLIIPTILGLLVLTQFVRKIAWLSRWTFAFVVGFGAGYGIPLVISQYLLKQIDGTVKPLWPTGWTMATAWASFSALFVAVGVLATLVHFFYSIEHRGSIRWTARLGVLFLMVSFGASFGYTTMARLSLLFGRTADLIDASKTKYYWATPVLLGVMIVVFVVRDRMGRKQSPAASG